MNRSPQAASELHRSIDQLRLTSDDCNDLDEYTEGDSSDYTITTHSGSGPQRVPRPYFNPLQPDPVIPATTPSATAPRYRFSHPLRHQQEIWQQQQQSLLQQREARRKEKEEAFRQEQEVFHQQQEALRHHQNVLQQQQDALRMRREMQMVQDVQPVPKPTWTRRHPSKLQSYRGANPRLRLRQRTSLETIASIRTTPNVNDVSESELADTSTQGSSDPTPSVLASSQASSLRSTSISSTLSSSTASPSVESVEPAKSLLHRFHSKTSESSEKAPDRLVIERKVSIGHTSQPSWSSGEPRCSSSETTHSQSSSEWRASEHDTSSLSAEELRRCKKKGINPALYAEMKAAKKGKWMSPIAGNTFLS